MNAQNSAAALADFLDAKAREVAAIEAGAETLIRSQADQAGYAEFMRKKAGLLAGLAEEAEHLLDGLPEPLAQNAAERLEQFSANAAMALRIGSVFFMSALLYPDEHKQGEPNNLELLAAEVRARA